MTMSLEKRFKEFKPKAESLGAEVHRTKNPVEAITLIKKIVADLAKEQGKDIKTVWADTPGLASVMDQAKEIPNIYFGDDIPAHAESSTVGVSQMEFGIAETGSIAQDATDILKRLVSTLSFAHIAIVPTQNIAANLADTIQYFGKRVPSYIAYISGPSRTADIERVLTIGVHGPERLIIIFVDEVGGDK